jgi:chromosome segregation ATPase
LQQKEANTAEIQKYKQKLNEALVTASEARCKLQQAERELSFLNSKMNQETAEAKSQQVVRDDDTNKIASLERELVEKASLYSVLQNQAREETAPLESKLAAKDALLNATEKMLAEFRTKVEELQLKEKQLEAKHAAEITQIKEEWEETKDELTCAEAEVLRGRTRIQEVRRLFSWRHAILFVVRTQSFRLSCCSWNRVWANQ